MRVRDNSAENLEEALGHPHYVILMVRKGWPVDEGPVLGANSGKKKFQIFIQGLTGLTLRHNY